MAFRLTRCVWGLTFPANKGVDNEIAIGSVDFGNEMTKFWTVALLLAGAQAFGQANPATAAGGSLDEWSQLPRQVVTFSGNTPLSGLPHSPAITLPLRCSPQGDAFLEILLPPDFRQRSLVSISAAGKVTTYITPDMFENMLPITYFPAEKHLYKLIAAQKKSAAGGGSASAGEPGTTSHAPSDFYVLKYKDDGTFEDVHKLDVSLVPVRLGAFPSGKLLVGGYETVNHAPQFLVMDSDGNNSHPIDLAVQACTLLNG